MRVNELIEKRKKAFEDAKEFVKTHENENGVLSAEDKATYEKMEIEIAKTEARRSASAEKTSAERSQEIARMMKSLSGLSADEKNAIVREVVQECTWDGETLFLRL